MGRKIAEVVGKKLGTEIHVGSVDLGFFNRIIIDDMQLKDQQNKDLLRIGRLSARINLLALPEGQISIYSIQLFGAHAYLNQKDETSKPNYQFVIDSLASKDTTQHTPLDLRINSLIIRHSNVVFDRHDQPVTPEHFNPYHLNVKDISAHVIIKTLTDDSLNVNIKRIAFKEQSGMQIKRLTTQITANRNTANMEKFILELPNSRIQFDDVKATYDLNRFKQSLNCQGHLSVDNLSPSDLACFLLPLKKFDESISLTTNFTFTPENIHIPTFLISTTTHSLDLNAHSQLKRSQKGLSQWELCIDHLNISKELFTAVQHAFPSVPDFLTRFGDVQLNGKIGGNDTSHLHADVNLISEAGSTDIKFTLDQLNAFTADIKAEAIDLRQLFESEPLGKLNAQIEARGSMNQVNARGTINNFEFLDYPYEQIDFAGEYGNGDLSGQIKIIDPHLHADLTGRLNSGKRTAIDVVGTIKNLSPQALHLSNQWGDAIFDAKVDANFVASSLNDAEGSVLVDSFFMRGSDVDYSIDHLRLTSGYEEDQHYLSFKSDFGEGDLRGDFDWASLPQSFINYIGSKLPTLPGLPPILNPTDNAFDINLNIRNTEWVRNLLGFNLSLHHPASISAAVNDAIHHIHVDASIPSFSINGERYSGGIVQIETPNDTMNCRVSLQKYLKDGSPLSIDLTAFAADNNLQTSMRWDNHDTEHHMSGVVNAIGQVNPDEEGHPEAEIHILPSHFILNNARWLVAPSMITYSDKRISVDNFAIQHDDQHLIVNGVASTDAADTLIVDLKQIDVAYVLELVNFDAVSFGGQATGRAYLSQAFSNLSAWTDLSVDHFKFQDGRMGQLHTLARWNSDAQQIDINAVADDGLESRTLIDGFVSPTHETIDLGIQARGTYLDFMNSYTKSFLNDVTGHAYGMVRLFGPLSNIDLTGKLVVDGTATVTSLNTTYELRRDTITLQPCNILVDHIPLYDKYDNVAYMSGSIRHEFLSNLTFDLSVTADNLLAYDFPDFGNNSFYGTVYASGNVDIHGIPNEIVINCNVTPVNRSSFTYNAATMDAINNQEFITWRQRESDVLEKILSNTAWTPDEDSLQMDTDSTTLYATSTRPASTIVSVTIPSSTDIYINFLVNSTSDATVRLLMDERTNDYINLHGEGVIRASFHNKGPFHMFGTYTVERGTYDITIQNIIKKNFTFQQGGTFTFGGDPFDAILNLQASYTVNGVSLSDLNIGNSFSSNTIRVNCLMNISGQAGSPKVDFDLDMPTVNAEERQMIRSIIAGEQELNQQVLYLLGIGRFYTQGVNNAEMQQEYGQTELAMQSLLSGTVSSQINNLLSQVIKSNDWNFGANISTGNEGWHNAEYEGMVSGRMLNNRLLINGQFGYRDNAKQATPSFIGDFDIRYLLYPNGNLALKVYNQTNDRYFTRSSLNTQGVGVIMKKDFSTIGDLLGIIKKKKIK